MAGSTEWANRMGERGLVHRDVEIVRPKRLRTLRPRFALAAGLKKPPLDLKIVEKSAVSSQFYKL